MATAWSFLSLDETERQFAGNLGYEDDLARHYSWDIDVPNHGRVSKGDLAVLRDGAFILGMGWIDNVNTWKADKDRFRCPYCRSTGFKERKKSTPRFKCDRCRKTFDTRTVEHRVAIDVFRADYARTWRARDVPLPVSAVDSAYRNQAKQHAIREMDLDAIRTIADATQTLGEPWWTSSDPSGTTLPGGHRVVLGKGRIGQQRFREEMLARFGSSCAICGPLPAAVLEAAHAYRYADRAQHERDGGLLLRRDLHALFDRNLLLIDPDDGWRVRVSPSLRTYPEIWKLDGAALTVTPAARPSADYLREHAAFCRASW